MAPVRRYLRITKHWVIEVRIYSEPPSIADSWLLRRADPAITRVMQAVRPMVMPKLREERERAAKKGKAARKVVKETIVGEDFEVSLFLTENSSRHTLLTKHKTFHENRGSKFTPTRQTSWLTGGNTDAPIDLDDVGGNAGPAIRQEEGDEPIDLDNIPEAAPEPNAAEGSGAQQQQQQPLFVESDESDDAFQTQQTPQPKRRRKDKTTAPANDDAAADDDKKFAIRTTYDGFAIYGRILCLVVKRKGSSKQKAATSQQMLENWVSTQAAQDAGVDEGDGDG